MYVYVFVFLYSYVCFCMHMYAYVCICMHMYAYVCICLHGRKGAEVGASAGMAGMGPVPASPCGSPVYPDKERIGHALHLLCTAALVFEADSLVALNCRRALIIVHNPFTQEVEKRAAKPFPASRMSQIRLTGNKLIVSQEHIDLFDIV